ncbi:MAG: ribosome silencing factor [Oscillospiraceae bacterium]|nr:ribosome silencing factor [Oscillospiraceae bacterium]
MNSLEKTKKIVKILDNKLAEDIKAINIHDLTILADYFVIATGNSNTQVNTLVDEVEYKMTTEYGVKPTRTEGEHSGWTILDYSDVVVHIFHRETREFYNLDKLWSDGTELDVEEIINE